MALMMNGKNVVSVIRNGKTYVSAYLNGQHFVFPLIQTIGLTYDTITLKSHTTVYRLPSFWDVWGASVSVSDRATVKNIGGLLWVTYKGGVKTDSFYVYLKQGTFTQRILFVVSM